MTSENEVLKTNEFLRRRKLRLQQVREQSKDIAKNIRQRVRVEKLRQVVDLDAAKQKEYLQQQEKLVKHLEILYAQGIQNVGASHRSAAVARQPGELAEKTDLSRLRGKEAAAELRRQKQEKLDKQKKVLDRKLQAREAANEISREKSAAIANKLQVKCTSIETEDIQNKVVSAPDTLTAKESVNILDEDNVAVARNDMGTQWEEEMPKEWEPNVPKLSLAKNNDTIHNNIETKSDKSKRLDLFAVSEEMPSSLRGAARVSPLDRIPEKSSLTLVSEYLQNRGLRLRESETSNLTKKNSDDLYSLKQTILRTRTSKPPSVPGKGSSIDKSAKSSAQNSALTKKNSVTMYNHSTRDTRDVPYHDEGLVVRDLQTDEDAYSQAMKEASTDNNRDKEHYKKIQDARHKIAMTKRNVEKEYKDTMTFLNSLPKDKGNKPIKNAYMDGRRQQMQKEIRQQKLQQEYKKIEKECRKHTCRNKTRSESKSPANVNDDDFSSKDFQYSWMPVPESDGSLAIHTIPTNLKDGKSGNTVKFSKVDSYHEYRSRHKHTPPTKDTGGLEKSNKRVEAVIVQNDSSDSTDTLVSDSSSRESLSLENIYKNTKNSEQRLSDAERIIIYKILDTKNDKKIKKAKLVKDIAKSLTSIDKVQKSTNDDNNNEQLEKKNLKKTKDAVNKLSFEQLNEGVYKSVNENGDNVTSMYFSDRPQDVDKASCCEEEIGNSNPCCHNNKSAAHLQWESNDEPRARTPKRNVDCDCACPSTKHRESINILNNQPSTATSSSSFKTATNDKANNAMPLSSYIKLIDASGQEAGNFYIGASGFLKDDAYEVVFQLRKKDAGKGDDVKIDERESGKEEKVQSVEELTKKNDEKLPDTVTISEASASQKATDDNQDNIANRYLTAPIQKQNISQKSHLKQDQTVVNVLTHVPINENVKNDVVINNESSDGEVISSHTIEARNLIEKGVCTSFQDSYAIPSHVPKFPPVSRPATSTYTQTTLNSPNHRPVYFHMSSSTSTAYMSPPEIILPNFLKQGYHLTDDEINDPRNFNMQEKIEITEQQEYCEQYAGCKCQRCTYARKITLSKATPVHWCRKSKCKNNKNTKTPPNTARSCDTAHTNLFDNIREDMNESAKEPSKKLKCKCRKCELHALSNSNLKSCIHKNIKNVASSRQSSRNLGRRVASSTTSSHKGKKINIEKRYTPKLNPVIKRYINKLLSLNKESLKAVEVIDQECSSIATPGSSIINVPYNIDGNKSAVAHKISLEQIKSMLTQQIMNSLEKKEHHHAEKSYACTKSDVNKTTKLPRIPRKKSLHKIKSLNISKRLLTSKTAGNSKQTINKPASSSSTPKEHSTETTVSISTRPKIRSKSSPTPRQMRLEVVRKNTASDIVATDKSLKDMILTDCNTNSAENNEISSLFYKKKPNPKYVTESYTVPSHRATITSTSPDSENSVVSRRRQKNYEIPMNTSTQTNENIDGELNFMKVAENKLQNMEKIADLTEKCTKRLSNLAKVLEEVRKHKSLAYSQISTSDSMSDSDPKSDKNVRINKPLQCHDSLSDNQKSSNSNSPVPCTTLAESNEKTPDSTCFVPFLTDIPKPGVMKLADCDTHLQSKSNSTEKSNRDSPVNEDLEPLNTKSRGKPPPALSRMNLKLGQGHVIPHELSTVIEVDSPMSMKYKNHSARNDTKHDVPDFSNITSNGNNNDKRNEQSYGETSRSNGSYYNPDLLQSNVNISKLLTKFSTTESSEDSKVQMIDLKQFNEIMLQPFFSIQEYAKQYSVGTLDEESNIEDIPKDTINDELSSLHSDGSLPDVIAELLKRNIINEPFKFENASNVNSTTISSESTLSVLALSKTRKEKKKSSVMFKNKENMGETSDTLSFSSNPDLENAFKKLGMGWASSTLKKTKERLALSSSSNTSSSSLSQFKVKNFNNQDVPVLVSDTVSSVLNLSKKPLQRRNTTDNAKSEGQQTSLTNSMTVKEFLANELAKKITFTNKSRNDTEEEFVSLFETKMPENMKHSSQMIREERSIDESVRSANNNNRARTSTPVQLFKSMTYQSSSSSNMSTALFSNADDLSSVKVTSNSMKHSTSDKDDLTIPNFSLKIKKGSSDCSKSD